MEQWKAELTLQPPRGFEHVISGLRIQRTNHLAPMFHHKNLSKFNKKNTGEFENYLTFHHSNTKTPSSLYIETCQLICSAYRLTDFHMLGTYLQDWTHFCLLAYWLMLQKSFNWRVRLIRIATDSLPNCSQYDTSFPLSVSTFNKDILETKC